jgi:unsaturated rhamnogalacturonyl hydrolase
MAHQLSRRRLLAGAAGVTLVPGAAAGTGAAEATLVPSTAAGASAAPSPALPSRADVLGVLRRVNDQWIGAHGNPGDNQWARAAYFSGNMALYRATTDARYLGYAQRWAEQNNYAIHNGVATRHADDHMAGQVYYDLNDIAPDPAKVGAINESIRRMVYSSSLPTKADDWWWVDALHMAMPVFVRVARATGDDAYLRKLWALYTNTKKSRALYDYTYELWYRDGDAKNARSPAGKPVFWSRGNGWAIAAHAKVLGLWPGIDARWPEYRYNIQGLARSLAKSQRADGFWNVNLADPNHLPGPETSGTAFFVFGLAYGIRTGILSAGRRPCLEWHGRHRGPPGRLPRLCPGRGLRARVQPAGHDEQHGRLRRGRIPARRHGARQAGIVMSHHQRGRGWSCAALP